jgi:small multidrug resistance family-3 protein
MDGVVSILRSLGIFGAAAVCEIAGGWLIWKALRDGRPAWWGLWGVVLLILFGAIITLQTSHFGRIYAAYGGIFVALSILWGWGLDRNRPDWPDVVGGVVVLVGVGVIVYWPRLAQGEPPDSTEAEGARIQVTGKTQPVPGRVGTIAPIVGHPVREVLVAPGERVKAGQVLIRLGTEDGSLPAARATLAEWQERLRQRQAKPPEEEQAEARKSLESACSAVQEARRVFAGLETPWKKGEVPEQRYQRARSALALCEAEERVAAARLERLTRQPADLEVAELEARVAAAKAAVRAAEVEVGQQVVKAPIAGVVSWLAVQPGATAAAGATAWGEILDLGEVDVRCELTPRQADGVAAGDAAQVIQEGVPDGRWAGRVVAVGVAADEQTGNVPVLVRVNNSGERLRCYVKVIVHFDHNPTGDQGKGRSVVNVNGMDGAGRAGRRSAANR